MDIKTKEQASEKIDQWSEAVKNANAPRNRSQAKKEEKWVPPPLGFMGSLVAAKSLIVMGVQIIVDVLTRGSWKSRLILLSWFFFGPMIAVGLLLGGYISIKAFWYALPLAATYVPFGYCIISSITANSRNAEESQGSAYGLLISGTAAAIGTFVCAGIYLLIG